MKRLLLWLIGVALGVVVLLAAVLGVSYSFTSEGAKPASEVQFAGQELEPNGWCWQVPLLGGQVDKVFASPRTLTVQKLGVLYDAHPAFALPEWYSYGPLTITDSAGNVVFEGTAATYDDFLFPANGDYAGHPVRGRQHRRAAAGRPARKAREAHRLVLLLFPLYAAGKRRGGAFLRTDGAGRHGGRSLYRHGG